MKERAAVAPASIVAATKFFRSFINILPVWFGFVFFLAG
jgi:hypothetical protein